jgi:hypothetical protein
VPPVCSLKWEISSSWFYQLVVEGNDGHREDGIDTTLIPLRAQYGATRSKAGKGNPSKHAAFAIPCNPLQRLSDHS